MLGIVPRFISFVLNNLPNYMINREAPELLEALRLQKLRAVEHILDFMNSSEDGDIAVAIEILEDVYVNKGETEIYEQNKNYNPESKFSLNSEEILKSFCSFIDIWVHNEFSNKISFCFLSTNSIAKERPTARTKKLDLIYPKDKILDILVDPEKLLTPEIANLIKAVVTDFYEENYSEESVQIYHTLKSIDEDLWIVFLNNIRWVFGHPSVDALELSVKTKISDYELFSIYSNRGTEDIIKSRLLDIVEKKATNNDRLFKLVQRADVRNAFLEVIDPSQEISDVDDVYKLWETIEKPDDSRNLSEKILSVCPDFDKIKLSIYERKASMAKVEERRLKNSPKYLALKYRVFEYCYENLYNYISKKENIKFNNDELTLTIETISIGCISEFNELKKDYDYGKHRESIIMELFIEFIDSCYLAFD